MIIHHPRRMIIRNTNKTSACDKAETKWKKKKQLLIAVVEMHENKKTRTIYKQLEISDFLSTVIPPFFCCTTECACVKLK